jgi:hypothetical protein
MSIIKNVVRSKKCVHNNQLVLQCCPVLKPQIVGEPLFPGAVTTNWSIVHSPIAPPPFKKPKKKWLIE